MSDTVNIGGREFRVVSSTPAKRSPAKQRMCAVCTPLDGPLVTTGVLLLSGAPPSVNSLFYNRAKGRGKTLDYRNWQAAAVQELSGQPRWHVAGKVEVRIYLPATARGDADNRIKATLDLLVRVGRIEDDRNVVKVSAEFSPGDGTVIHIQQVQAMINGPTRSREKTIWP